MPPAVESMLSEDRLVHALCLEGDPGTGRLRLCYALAGAVLCERHTGRMCGECVPCRKVLLGAHSDITLPDAGEGGYKKDAVRSLRGAIYRSPSEGRAKVIILPEAQTMSQEVQNLLLSVMEEPPPDTYFFLTCDNRYRLLSTVISRMVTVAMPPRPEETVLGELRESETGKTAEAVLVAMAAGGGYALLAALQKAEKNRQEYAAVLEAAGRLLGMALLRSELGISTQGCIRLRRVLAEGTAKNNANGYLPLVTATMAERAARKNG